MHRLYERVFGDYKRKISEKEHKHIINYTCLFTIAAGTNPLQDNSGRNV